MVLVESHIWYCRGDKSSVDVKHVYEEECFKTGASLRAPSLFLSHCKGVLCFQVEGQVTLLDSLPKLITTIPVEKLTEFFRRGFQWSLRECCHGDGDRVRLTALAGLWGALKVHAPPPAVTGLLYQTLQETFALWSRSATWVGVLEDRMVSYH